MKGLVLFYTRTGCTKEMAELIANESKFELEEIVDKKKRKGIIGYIRAAMDASREKLTTINEVTKNPGAYDLVVIGTPIWDYRLTPAIRTYITQNKSKFKKVAFFCTKGGTGTHSAFEHMEKLCEKKPLSMLDLNRREIKKGLHMDKIKKFIQDLK